MRQKSKYGVNAQVYREWYIHITYNYLFNLTNMCVHNYDFNWNDVRILSNEQSYNKCLVSEMIHIKKQQHTLNKQNDTESVPDAYLPIIQLLSPS